MKKHAISFIFILAFATVLVGCLNSNAEAGAEYITGAESGITGDILERDEDNDPVFRGDNAVEKVNPMRKYIEGISPPGSEADIDFTTFGGDEFDQEFSDIFFVDSEDFFGKTIRLVGPYAGYYDDESDQYKHHVLVDDVAGCCFRYVEFAFNDESTFRKNLENYTLVDVTGVFGSYYDEELEWDFNYLVVDEIFILEEVPS